MSSRAGPPRPALEVADILRQHGEAFLAQHGSGLTATQRRALRDLAVCRTAALGGHVQRCLDCGQERIAYNSCRNRHCPKCQALARARWLQREADLLLPVDYYHVVFTLPAEVAEVALANPALLYDALFQAASATLRDVAANPKWLGAQVGSLLVLHTWGQNLHHHPHVHAVVTGGGLSCNAAGKVDAKPQWRNCRPGFFLPVRVLSRVFRGKYLELLRHAYQQGQLNWPGTLQRLTDLQAWQAWLRPLDQKEWVVYAKPPFGGPAQVLKYLARYTHRVAISNQRLLALTEGQVRFVAKDYADGQRSKTVTLTAVEFLRRFVQHVLPKGFVKIRHYGLLANRQRAQQLALSRQLLALLLVAALGSGQPTTRSAMLAVEPAAVPQCPHCGGCRLVRLALPAEAGVAPEGDGDTS